MIKKVYVVDAQYLTQERQFVLMTQDVLPDGSLKKLVKQTISAVTPDNPKGEQEFCQKIIISADAFTCARGDFDSEARKTAAMFIGKMVNVETPDGGHEKDKTTLGIQFTEDLETIRGEDR